MRVVINKGKDNEFSIEIEGVQGVDEEKVMVTLTEIVISVMESNFFKDDSNLCV